MGKLEKSIYAVIILVLVAAIACGTTYLVMMDKDNTNTENNEEINKNSNDGVKLVDVKLVGDEIIKNFDVTLNGKQNTLTVKYSYNYDSQFHVQSVVGRFGKAVFSEYEYSDLYFTKSDIFNVERVRERLTADDFIIIKGNDSKNYLGVISSTKSDNVLYILNDNLDILDVNSNDIYYPLYRDVRGFMITTFYNSPCLEKGFTWYDNTFNIIDEIYRPKLAFKVKIEDNKIYYLALKGKDVLATDGAVIEERVYTINNDKLSYEVINTYKDFQVCQTV